jgi:putative ABC transport system substrate-binding protein
MKIGNSNISQLILCAACMLFALCSPAEAQQAGKLFRIGFLDSSTASGSASLVNAFRQELGKLGWVEGKNVSIEYRFAGQQAERLPDLAAELGALKVDVIVASSPTISICRQESYNDPYCD